MPELLDRIRQEISARLDELGPLVDEHVDGPAKRSYLPRNPRDYADPAAVITSTDKGFSAPVGITTRSA